MKMAIYKNIFFLWFYQNNEISELVDSGKFVIESKILVLELNLITPIIQ